MKPLILTALLITVSVSPALSSGQAACEAVIAANVEVARGEFSLADLIARGTCPAQLHAASRVRLGIAPLPGSMRVLEGAEVRALFEKVVAGVENGVGGSTSLRVPERVTVRRAGARANCAGIVGRIFAPLDPHPSRTESRLPELPQPDADEPSPRETDCGAAGRIPQEAALEQIRRVWNPALGGWDVFARCVDPGECVPFLVRMLSHDFPAEITASARPTRSAATARAVPSLPFAKTTFAALHEIPLVRPGETVSLLWDQDGIRLVVPAICLDAGRRGEEVRARLPRGWVVHAIVVSAGKLRAAS